MYFKKSPEFLKYFFSDCLWDGEYSNNIYLTFDDGPHPKSTPLILNLLSRSNTKATFFCLGKNVKKYPYLFQRILQEGHAIGHHGFEHLSGWTTRNKNYLNNALQSTELIDSKLFRPPFGRMTWTQYKSIKEKFKIVMWSHMPGDFDPKVSQSLLAERLLSIQSSNPLIVLHDHPNTIDKLLPSLARLINSKKESEISFGIIES